jgi:hypothetical protein
MDEHARDRNDVPRRRYEKTPRCALWESDATVMSTLELCAASQAGSRKLVAAGRRARWLVVPWAGMCTVLRVQYLRMSRSTSTRRRRLSWRAVLAVTSTSLVALSAGCGGEVPAAPGTSPLVPSADSAANAEAPARFRDRTPLPSCGTISAGSGATALSEQDRGMADCLLNAFEAGEPGEVAVVLVTTEGDPVFVWVRVLGSGQVEQFVDSTADTFGSGRWAFASCTTVGVTERGVPVADGCGAFVPL